jgi:hypothetical protein
MMSQTQIVFDEIAYFQKEPPPYQQMLEVFSRIPMSNKRMIGVEQTPYHEVKRELERRKRKKAMENCQHGRLPFPIRWAPGVFE